MPDDPTEEKADRIDGAIGELSRFHETFGYYGHGVGIGTATLPQGWRERLVVFDTPGTAPGRGLCLDPHDCVIAKLVAGRPKDVDFATALVHARLIDVEMLADRLVSISGVDDHTRRRIERWLERSVKADRGGR